MLTGNRSKRYSLAIAKGTRARVIRSKGKKMKFNPGGGNVFANEVRHPGTKANPHLKKSLEVIRKIYR